jgi:hypothetical protein
MVVNAGISVCPGKEGHWERKAICVLPDEALRPCDTVMSSPSINRSRVENSKIPG